MVYGFFTYILLAAGIDGFNIKCLYLKEKLNQLYHFSFTIYLEYTFVCYRPTEKDGKKELSLEDALSRAAEDSSLVSYQF